MARTWSWYTRIGQLQGTTTAQLSLFTGPGTVQRIVGRTIGTISDFGGQTVANAFYTVSVGTAPEPPVYVGLDPEHVMLHGAMLLVNPVTAAGSSGIEEIRLDTEGQRVVEAGESLWFRVDRGSPAVAWMWQLDLRVLVLDPEPAP